MEKKNLKTEMEILCDMQIEMWNDLKNDLAADHFTNEEVCAIFHKHLRETHHEAVSQLFKTKILMDEIE